LNANDWIFALEAGSALTRRTSALSDSVVSGSLFKAFSTLLFESGLALTQRLSMASKLTAFSVSSSAALAKVLATEETLNSRSAAVIRFKNIIDLPEKTEIYHSAID